ncbi:MAG: dTDP-4-dehydrorhamnose 3,5-epimerase [Candidatus Liberibacter ctenarytainae]|uniref:dTDP-4-dehydrorhamnose 3,5-epimerase n=1 Tax=Candidatus Liberibacter ctenarytainae TaxID=2020335 RepID=A0A937ASP4_9HYPH|nr:dTDP-4-dehydrorhamnose 3,5-epimerase [Candidatus Liberibacter ctenarytainae]
MVLNSVCVIKIGRCEDNRGWFSETYSSKSLKKIGLKDIFVQDNHSFSSHRGTIRGLHFQKPPHSQAKLVRCISGQIFDVAVDIRKNSPTYGKWVGLKISEENGLQLYIPVGFAHGFMTLTPHAEVIYKVTDFYSADHDSGVLWSDKDIGIDWPLLDKLSPSLSDKDMNLLPLNQLDSPFEYNGVALSPLNIKQDILCV